MSSPGLDEGQYSAAEFNHSFFCGEVKLQQLPFLLQAEGMGTERVTQHKINREFISSSALILWRHERQRTES